MGPADRMVLISRWHSNLGTDDPADCDWRVSMDARGTIRLEIMDALTGLIQQITPLGANPQNPNHPEGSWADGKWHNAVVSMGTREFAGNCTWTVRLWVDLVETDTAAPLFNGRFGGGTGVARTTAVDPDDVRVYIGGQYDDSIPITQTEFEWVGEIDEVVLWSRNILTGPSVGNQIIIYNNGCPGDIKANVALAPGLKAWYRMGDFPGDDSYFNGTIHNAITGLVPPNNGTVYFSYNEQFVHDVPGTACLCLPTSSFYQDFVGLNTLIVDPLYPSQALISSSTDTYQNTSFAFLCPQNSPSPDELHALLLHRDGPYGWPTWKQIRGFENPLVRYYRKNNLITCNANPGKTRVKNIGTRVTIDRFGPLNIFKEPAVTSQFSVIQHTLGLRTTMTPKSGPPYSIVEPVTIQSTLGNNLGLFTNQELNWCANTGPCEVQAYDTIKDMYLNGALNEDSPAYSFIEMVYKERIYPAGANASQKITRERVGYENDFWKNDRADRSALGAFKWGGS